MKKVWWLRFIILMSLVCSPYVNAGHVACGATLTEDTVLDNDLSCSGNGLIIGRDNVTLDCNGYGIEGNGGGTGISVSSKKMLLLKIVTLKDLIQLYTYLKLTNP